MYHCHVSFYLIGQPCRELELIQSMAPPENFTYEFHESRGFLEDEAAKADVIVANLRNGDVTELLDGLTTAKKWKTELIVLAVWFFKHEQSDDCFFNLDYCIIGVEVNRDGTKIIRNGKS